MRQAERLTNLMVLNLWDGYWEPEKERGYVASLLNAGGRVLDVGQSTRRARDLLRALLSFFCRHENTQD